MTLEVKESGGSANIHIYGVIKSMDDSLAIKQSITEQYMKDKGVKIILVIEDSFIMTSSVIGTILKMIQKDKMNISIHVRNAELIELLQKLNLVQLLNVTRI